MTPKHGHITGTACDKMLQEEFHHCNIIASLHQMRIHTASDELDSAGWRGLIHSTLRRVQYSVGSMMDHWGCKSMAWSTPIDHNVFFFVVFF